MKLKTYTPSDGPAMYKMFCETVHEVNKKDYTKEQLDVWADGKKNLDEWSQSFCTHDTLVAWENEQMVGFGDMDETGYLDRLYIHKDFQKKGIASAICKALEERSGQSVFTVDASITARPFFERLGYEVLREQQVERKGIFLTNYKMRKPR